MIRCTLRLPEKTRGRVTGHYDLTGTFDPLPSGLAQVVVCWRKDALSTRTIRRIQAALRPDRTVRRYLDRLPAHARPFARRIEPRTDGTWVACGPVVYGGAMHDRVLAVVPARQRSRLVAVDPRVGDFGQVVPLVTQMSPTVAAIDATDDEELDP